MSSSAAPRVVRAASARRIALAAQGFHGLRPDGPVTTRSLQRVIDRVGVVQIDSVNVLVRSQYLPFFSRLGAYDRDLLDRARDRAPRRLVEYWAHEASLIPPATWPLLDFRMQRAHADAWGGMRRVARDHPDLVAQVLAEVQGHGPLTTRECEARLAADVVRPTEHWGWNWSLVKNALEHLFWAGDISSAGRTAQFERRYDAVRRVLPPTQRAAADPASRPAPAEAFVELMRIAARAHGIATVQCLRDYFRLSPEQAAPALETLVGAGELEPVTIEGWNRPAYLHVDAARPRAVHAEALLSPFDSLIWQRDRTHKLWDFHYRLEIYVPAPQRVHGYYVLPFLFGDRLVGRVDLKADRAAGALLVQGVHWEVHADVAARRALGRQLEQMADWLDLDRVTGPGMEETR
ncbi:winged helix-turn-helix domain-containing protein [Allobranchiibius sp. GilTou73]|uniref:winged helix-turn-helix domain-containing protein n=1 Tax=Allobranchiibius sp. GilTou73 TaxID=2904523 RepID=UPI001F475318|nr:crosslink repair DNA glycosylase YcaQ family protein [Allobranchiibius sp. GilTou73]UIJ34603.1 winged helix DNA-binding domain-containing protein [Allobranchiibius sp. GilTou73]